MLKNIHLILLALLPIIGFFAPRILAYAPLIIGLVGLISNYGFERKIPELNPKILLFFGIILGVLWSCMLWAKFPDISFERLTKLSLVFASGLLCFAALQDITTEQVQLFFKIFIISLIISGMFFTIELFLNNGPLRDLKNLPPKETLGSAFLNRGIIFYGFSALFALIMLCVSDYAIKTKQVLITLIAALWLAILFLTESQSAQLAVLIAAISFMIPIRQKTALFTLGVFLCVLIISAPFLVQYLFQNIAPTLAEFSWFQEGYAPHRLEIWDFIARYALENPWLGHGIEAVRAESSFDSAMLYHEENHVLHPHNFALQLWAEFGVLGAILGGGVMIFILKEIGDIATENQKSAQIALALFMMGLSVAATGYGIWQSWWIGALIIVSAYITILKRST